MRSERAWLGRETVARLPLPQSFAATSKRAHTLFSTEEELETLADTLSKLYLQSPFCYDSEGQVRSLQSTLRCSGSSVNTKPPLAPSRFRRKACNWPSSGRHSHPSAPVVSTLKTTISISCQSISPVVGRQLGPGRPPSTEPRVGPCRTCTRLL